MDKDYIKECTSTWVLEEQSNNLKLYTYFDKVDWQDKWAILDNEGNCIYCWEDGEHGRNYHFFNAIVEIVSKIKP